jgi:hypothetical protein
MTHGEGWEFIRIGTLLERADCTSRILDVKYHLLLPSGERVGGMELGRRRRGNRQRQPQREQPPHRHGASQRRSR